MDEPLLWGREAPLFYPDVHSANHTCDYIIYVRLMFPNIKIIDTEAYPAVSAGDLKSWMGTIRSSCQVRNTAPPDVFQLDHDWNAANSVFTWFLIRDVRDEARSWGMEFGLIFWPAANSNDVDWYTRTREYALKVQEQQVDPEFYTVESWDPNPSITVPESSPYTFMWSTLALQNEGLLPSQPPPPPPGGDATFMYGGEQLYSGQSRFSPNGQFELKYQSDGNLVLYEGGTPRWAINCWPTCNDIGGPNTAIMQQDGNFVAYNSSGAPVWDSGTYGNSGAYLAIYNDGRLIVHSASGAVLWSR